MTAPGLLAAGVEFHAGPHRYVRHGSDYTSVTKMLDDVGANGADKQWFKQEHRTRGSRVHHLANTIAHLEHPNSEYEWDEVADFPEIVPYGIAFQRWCREVGFEVLYAEHPVWSDPMRVAGTPDLIGYLRKRDNLLVLVDIKSGLVPPSVGLQTAAYQAMAEEVHHIKIDARFSLQLAADKPEGAYKFRPCRNPLDFSTFLHFLGVWNWLKDANKLIEAV